MAHHVFMTLLSCSWLIVPGGHPFGWFSCFANSCIHMCVYYFFLSDVLGRNSRSARVWWQRSIVVLQLLQYMSLFVAGGIWGVISLSGWYYPGSLHSPYCSDSVLVVFFTYAVYTPLFWEYINYFFMGARLLVKNRRQQRSKRVGVVMDQSSS